MNAFAKRCTTRIAGANNAATRDTGAAASGSSACAFRIIADSAGASVTDVKNEIAVDTAIVTPNWRKNWPEMPGMNEVGTNTAQSTSVIANSAPPTSFIVNNVASRGPAPVDKCRSTFSTTTIALSTTIPTASTRPNSVRLLIEYPSTAIAANVPTSDTGIDRIGMIDGRQPCRNSSTTNTTSTTAS